MYAKRMITEPAYNVLVPKESLSIRNYELAE
jgi:hypothetical protein